MKSTTKAGERHRTLERDAYDVIIIGAGVGGLTAGALLAQRGQSVLVLDQHYVAGGNATIFRRRQMRFDIGIHYVGDCGPNGAIPRILRAAGIEDVQFREMDPDGFDVLCFPDLCFRIPRGFDAFRDRLVEHFPSEAGGIDRYLRLLREAFSLVRIHGPLHALATLARARLALRYSVATLSEFLDTCTRDTRLRAVLAGQAGTYGLPPSRVSLLIHAIVAAHYAQGAYYPVGGGQVVSERLAQAIEHRGGKLLLLSRACRILVAKGRVQGVELESKHLGRLTVRAPVVISNADLKQTFLELVGPQHLRPRTVRRLQGYEMSPPLGVLYLGAKRDIHTAGLGSRNYWLFPDYDCEPLYRELGAGRFHPDPFVYISSATLKEPDSPLHAPPGIANLQIMTMVPAALEAWGTTAEELASGAYRRNERYLQAKEAFAGQMLDQAERLLPGLRRDIVYQEVATPLTHSRYTFSTGGTSYGIASTPAQSLLGRPGSTTEVAGLYLAGANTRSGHGMGGTMQSGLLAAASILGMRLVGEVLGPANDV